MTGCRHGACSLFLLTPAFGNLTFCLWKPVAFRLVLWRSSLWKTASIFILDDSGRISPGTGYHCVGPSCQQLLCCVCNPPSCLHLEYICLHFSWEKSHLFSLSGVAWRSPMDIPILSGTCSIRSAQRLLGVRGGGKEMLQNVIISLHIDE